MLLQFTVIIAKVAPSIATKTGLRESLLTYGFLDYVHGYMFFLTMGLIKHFFFFFFCMCIKTAFPINFSRLFRSHELLFCSHEIAT